MALTWTSRKVFLPEGIVHDLHDGDEHLFTIHPPGAILQPKTWALTHPIYGWFGEFKSLKDAKAYAEKDVVSELGLKSRAKLACIRAGKEVPWWGSEVKAFPKGQPLFCMTVRFNAEPSHSYYLTYREAKEAFEDQIADSLAETASMRSGMGVGLERTNVYTKDGRSCGGLIAYWQIQPDCAVLYTGSGKERTSQIPRMGPYGPY